MLRIDDISYSIQGRPLFEGASATIPEGHKVGLVGPNGAGKTTLFRLIRGELGLDGGDISLPSRARIGGVAQEAAGTATSVLETVPAEDKERASLLAESHTATDAHRIADIQTRLADIDAWSAEARAPTARTHAAPTRSGWETIHSRVLAPPMEPPMTAAQRSIPSMSASTRSAATMSRTETAGNRAPQ